MKAGTVVTGSSQTRYRIEKRLGEGVTSEVYRAVDVASGALVALKVLRADVGPIIEANFWQEGQILGELTNAARAVDDGGSDVPLVVETQRVGEVRFLAMELVVGQPLDRVLEENEHLEEREALFVAQRVLRVLVLLHEQVRRTYTDFQLQNIWLQRDGDGVLTGIKVMDWNHVSERVKDGEPLPEEFGGADLARFGAYFYRMLTGKGADERGETERALVMRAGERWQALSLGTRQLVLRALHPHTGSRFASTRAFREAVLVQQALWAGDGLDLLFDVRMWLKNKESEKENVEQFLEHSALKEEQSKLILAKLDMAARLGAPSRHVAHYRAELKQEHVGEVSRAWKAGEQYYKVEQYREAGEKWRAEAEAKGRLELWRWVMVAEAGVQFGRRAFGFMREKVEAAVEALNTGDVQEAVSTLSRLEQANGSLHTLEVLKKEALARINIDDAFLLEKSEQLEEWEKAKGRYQTAQTALQNLPEPMRTLIYDAQPQWPNLSERIENLTEQIKERSESDNAVQEVKKLLADDFEAGRKKLERHLRREPSHRPLVRLCLTEAERLLRAGDAEEAKAMLLTGVLYAQVPEYREKLREDWRNAKKIARKLKRIKKKYKKALNVLKEKHAKAKGQYEHELNRLKEEHTQAKKEYKNELNTLEKQHSEKMASLERAYQKAFREQVDQYDHKLAKKQREHEQKLAELRKEYEQKLSEAVKALPGEYEQKLTKAKEQHERVLAKAKEQHEQTLTETRREHEQELSTLQAEQERALNAVKPKEQEAIGFVWEDKKEEFIKQLKKLLQEKQWGDFLDLAAQVPQVLRTQSAFGSPSSSVRRDFNRAIENGQVLIAYKLRRVLELIDSRSIGTYKKQYKNMMTKVTKESPELGITVQSLIEHQLESKNASYKQIVDAIEKLLPLIDSDFGELKVWLEETREEVEAKWLEEVPQEPLKPQSPQPTELAQKAQPVQPPQEVQSQGTQEVQLAQQTQGTEEILISTEKSDETVGKEPSVATNASISNVNGVAQHTGSDSIGQQAEGIVKRAPITEPLNDSTKTAKDATTGSLEGGNLKGSEDESDSGGGNTAKGATTGPSKEENVASSNDESHSDATKTTEVITTEPPVDDNATSSDDFSRSEGENTNEGATTESSEREKSNSSDGFSRSAPPKTSKGVTMGSSEGENFTSRDDESLSNDSKTTEAVTTETPEALIKKGIKSIKKLTYESVQDAKQYFKQAESLLHEADNSELRHQIRAGLKFIELLNSSEEARKTVFNINPIQLQKYINMDAKSTSWLGNNSVISWIKKVQQNYQEAKMADDQRRLEDAARFKDKALFLKGIAESVLDRWWMERMDQYLKLDLLVDLESRNE